jgi:hypothetical protein
MVAAIGTGTEAGMAAAMVVDMAALTAAVRGAPEVAVAMGDMDAETGWEGGLVEMARIKLDFTG